MGDKGEEKGKGREEKGKKRKEKRRKRKDREGEKGRPSEVISSMLCVLYEPVLSYSLLPLSSERRRERREEESRIGYKEGKKKGGRAEGRAEYHDHATICQVIHPALIPSSRLGRRGAKGKEGKGSEEKAKYRERRYSRDD